MASAKRNLKSSGTWTRPSRQRRRRPKQFALCITGAEPDLLPYKVYQVLPDVAAAKNDSLRVIDESGEDYLYPEQYFVLVKLPQAAEDALSVTP